MKILRLFTLICLSVIMMSVLPVLAQDTPTTSGVYASDMTMRGTRVAIALEDAVEVYDMRYPERAPLRYEIANVTALAFSANNDYLAMGTPSGITVVEARTMQLINQIDQPASALAWMMFDNRLITGWDNEITIFNTRGQELDAPYPVQETLTAYESLDRSVEFGHTIRSLHVFSEGGNHRTLYISYGYNIDYGNHGESFRGVSQYNVSQHTLSQVTGYMVDVIHQLEMGRFSEDGRYALIHNVWIDRETGQTVTLPINSAN